MKMEQQHAPSILMTRFYVFLRDRDARIIELFFFALNTYIFALVVLPPHTVSGWPFIWRTIFQGSVIAANFAALIQKSKRIRIISAIANASIMGLVAATYLRMDNPNAGTYGLLALLAAFVCWKINIKQ